MMHQTDVFARNSTREMRQRAWLHACTPTFTHYRKLFAAAAAAFNILSSFTSAIKSIKCYWHFPKTLQLKPDGVARNKIILETFKPNCFDLVRKRKIYLLKKPLETETTLTFLYCSFSVCIKTSCLPNSEIHSP